MLFFSKLNRKVLFFSADFRQTFLKFLFQLPLRLRHLKTIHGLLQVVKLFGFPRKLQGNGRSKFVFVDVGRGRLQCKVLITQSLKEHCRIGSRRDRHFQVVRTYVLSEVFRPFLEALVLLLFVTVFD